MTSTSSSSWSRVHDQNTPHTSTMRNHATQQPQRLPSTLQAGYEGRGGRGKYGRYSTMQIAAAIVIDRHQRLASPTAQGKPLQQGVQCEPAHAHGTHRSSEGGGGRRAQSATASNTATGYYLPTAAAASATAILVCLPLLIVLTAECLRQRTLPLVIAQLHGALGAGDHHTANQAQHRGRSEKTVGGRGLRSCLTRRYSRGRNSRPRSRISSTRNSRR